MSRTSNISIGENQPLSKSTISSMALMGMKLFQDDQESKEDLIGTTSRTSKLQKFQLLLWKNWLIQSRHRIQTFFEIFTPLFFGLVLVFLRISVHPLVVLKTTTYNTLPLDVISRSSFDEITSPVGEWQIAYSPKNALLEKLVAETTTNLKLDPFAALPDSASLQTYMLGSSKSFVAVQFDDNLKDITELPKTLEVSIRFPSELRLPGEGNAFVKNWHTNVLFPISNLFGGPRGFDSTGGPPSYMSEGFLAVQNEISLAFIKQITNDESKTDKIQKIFMNRFPYPPYAKDFLLIMLERFVSLIILLAFIYPVQQTVKAVTTEKETQLKEAMKIMGIPGFLHWSAWFIEAFVMKVIASTLLSLLLNTVSTSNIYIFTHSNWAVVLLIFYIYSIVTVTFCFMISAFFAKAKTAASVVGLIWYMSYIPYQGVMENYNNLDRYEKLFLSLFCNTAMGFAFKLVVQYEGLGEGLQWNNLFRPVTPDDNVSVGDFLIMMLITSIVYMIIALYVEKVMPGPNGVTSKWYFFLQREYWFGKQFQHENDFKVSDYRTKDPSAFENEPDKRVGIAIRSLHKTFGQKVAVNNLSLNFFEGEITALLGHNGAGKTTTVSMLTGIFAPTSGTAIINGYDIRYDLKGARSSLGICPQYNVLFDELTVKEHIRFFSRIKGVQKNDVKKEIEKYVKVLELEPKLNTESRKLSGGMKRKLSVGVALCGGSKIVLLDEPSSGMDPAARRSLWNVLRIEKKYRTILLSTHFMDEADVLGDRIAIMSTGDLKCYGTSFFLKKRFGTGYHLVCVKEPKCDPKKVTKLLREFIPNIKIESNIGTELSYVLPEKYSTIFEEMLFKFENNIQNLKIEGFGIAITSLEEVFMKVGAERVDDKKRKSRNVRENVAIRIFESESYAKYKQDRKNKKSDNDADDENKTPDYLYYLSDDSDIEATKTTTIQTGDETTSDEQFVDIHHDDDNDGDDEDEDDQKKRSQKEKYNDNNGHKENDEVIEQETDKKHKIFFRHNKSSEDSSDPEQRTPAPAPEKPYLLRGCKLIISQWKAMLFKKYLHNIRNLVFVGTQNLIPIVFICATVLIAKTYGLNAVLDALTFTIDDYDKSKTVYKSRDGNNAPKSPLGNIYASYIEQYGNEHKIIPIETDFNQYILEEYKIDIVHVNYNNIIGAEFKTDKIIAWYNNQLLHSAPLSLNVIHNVLLRLNSK